MEKEQSLTGITVCRKPIQKPIRISEETHTWLARSAFFGLFQRLAKDFACALHAFLIGVRIHAQGNGLIAVSELFRDACNVRAGGNCNARESVDENMSMTNAQYDSMLETLARLIEVAAKTPAEAAQIVRDAKTAGK